MLTKLHQGTHPKDASTNNLHALAYDIPMDWDSVTRWGDAFAEVPGRERLRQLPRQVRDEAGGEERG